MLHYTYRFNDVDWITDLDKKVYNKNSIAEIIELIIKLKTENGSKLEKRLERELLVNKYGLSALNNSNVRLVIRKQGNILQIAGINKSRIEKIGEEKIPYMLLKIEDSGDRDTEYNVVRDEDAIGVGFRCIDIDDVRWQKIQDERIYNYENKDVLEYSQVSTLYLIVKELNKLNIDYYIKGNVLLHFLLSGLNTDVYRTTKDLDMTMRYKDNFKDLREYLKAEKPDIEITYRDKFNSFKIDNLGNLLESIDITFDTEIFDTGLLTEYWIEDQMFKGSSIYKIVKDKVKVLGSRKIYQRAKDFVDIYILLRYMDITNERLVGFIGDGWNMKYMLEEEQLMSALLKNSSVFVVDNNLKRIYDYVINRFKQALWNTRS